jgi:hypothetical protein
VLILVVLAAAVAGGAGFVLARGRNQGGRPPAHPLPVPPHAARPAEAGAPDAQTHELLEVSRLLTAAAAAGDTKRAVVRGALTLVPADGAALVTVDSGQGLTVAVETTPGLLVPEAIGDGVLRRVAETGDVVDLRSASEPAVRNRPASVLALPLVAGGRVAAVLVVVRGQDLPFTVAETRTLRALAPMAAAVLQTERQTQHAIEESLHDPPLVLADEPTAHLDHIQVEGVLSLLRDLASPGRLVLVSTHDDRVTNLADRVVEMVPHPAGLDADREPQVLELRAGEIVFEQGSRGDLVYVVEKGQVEIVRERADGDEERLVIVRAGDYFGELGPVLNLPRSATARAKTSAVLTACTVRRFRRRFPAA